MEARIKTLYGSILARDILSVGLVTTLGGLIIEAAFPGTVTRVMPMGVLVGLGVLLAVPSFFFIAPAHDAE